MFERNHFFKNKNQHSNVAKNDFYKIIFSYNTLISKGLVLFDKF